MYAVHPGTVVSKNDGDMHYITAWKLIRLYGVDPNKCIIWDEKRPETRQGRKYEEYTHLYPKTNGNYDLNP